MLAEGDHDVAEGQPGAGIEDYGAAWTLALKALGNR